ncbi:PREDICTED: uncharacterized protein LOC105460987 isoform X1 [Wasmannia auropunctata]|uniref:uncharacterized protein LOC105460987 isoform X1 n=2 Tax=Wasmannia auropunctata TaxID=64793 RepID=UPI0005EE1C96|nr:PREDICTED: uncharacterized protein LOC105460987 isoform X1 [Wasmannia auropunctata]
MIDEAMSKQARVLELNKCISSRLWYTSLNIFHLNNDSDFLKEFQRNCCVDLTELEAVIESLIHSRNEEQYQWIAYVLLWKLVGSKSSNVDCNIQCNVQTQFDCIQIKNATKLCDNVPDCLHKEILIFLHEISAECSIKYTSSIIFQQIVTFLKDNVCINIEIICWIINKLISVIPNTHNIANNLRDIYFFTLKSCLEHIPAGRSWYLKHTTTDSSEVNSTTHDNSLQMILYLLSTIDIDADTQIKFLEIICPTVAKSYYIKDIELALYSRNNEKLLSEWLSLWNKTCACFESATTLLTAYKIYESIFKLTKNSEILLCKQELLKRISARKLHWLNDVLVSFIF